jgi:exodeoxyribonuclease VII small subunit
MNLEQKESVTYSQMLRQVEKIVQAIDAPDVDLDNMVQKLEQGYELVHAMRTRLEETKERVEKLRTRYEEETK